MADFKIQWSLLWPHCPQSRLVSSVVGCLYCMVVVVGVVRLCGGYVWLGGFVAHTRFRTHLPHVCGPQTHVSEPWRLSTLLMPQSLKCCSYRDPRCIGASQLNPKANATRTGVVPQNFPMTAGSRSAIKHGWR